MVKIQINLSNKLLYSLIAVFAILVISGITIAYNLTPSNPANPAVMGHTIDEIAVISVDGTNTSLEQYIENKISGVGQVTCNPVALINTMNRSTAGIAYSSGWESVTFPPECKDTESTTGCIIKQEIYDSSSPTIPKLTRQYPYIQYTSNNKWWSSYATSGELVNGDATESAIIPKYGSTRYLALYDDEAAEATPSANLWSFRDYVTTYGMKIFICSEVSA